MDKSKALSWAELRVGGVVILSLVVLAGTILYVGGGGGSPLSAKYVLKLLMSDVNGLKSGAPVRVGGVEVGSVTRVEFAQGGAGGLVEVTMRLEKGVRERVTTDSHATLGTLGLLGEKAIDITASSRGVPIEEGQYLPTMAEDPFKGLLSDASESSSHLKHILARIDAGEGLVGRALRDEELYTRMADVSNRLQRLLARLETQNGPLGRLLNDESMSKDVASSVRGIGAFVARVEAGQGPLGVLSKDAEVSENLRGLVSQMNSVTRRLDGGEGTLGRLMKDDALYQQLTRVSGRLDSILDQLDKGEGSAGKLFRDPELYKDLSATLKDVRGLVSDIRKDPRKYLRVKISLF